jgi:hypothetical protein
MSSSKTRKSFSIKKKISIIKEFEILINVPNIQNVEQSLKTVTEFL